MVLKSIVGSVGTAFTNHMHSQVTHTIKMWGSVLLGFIPLVNDCVTRLKDYFCHYGSHVLGLNIFLTNSTEILLF